MKKKQPPTLSPKEARTFSRICSLQRDNITFGDYWMLVQERTVVISKQKVGESRAESAELPRHIFEKFIAWYEKPQKVTRRCPPLTPSTP
jgi:hypothetical protein